MKSGERKAQIFGALETAGCGGLSSVELATVAGKVASWIYAYLAYFEDRKQIWRSRRSDGVRFVLSSACPPDQTVVERKHYRHRSCKVAPVESVPPQRAEVRHAVPSLAGRAQLVTPAVSLVNSTIGDSRYQVDPATFSGGEFMDDWKRRRAGGR